MLNEQEVLPEVAQTKQWRKDLDSILQRIERDSTLDPSTTDSEGMPAHPIGYRGGRERSHAKDKIREAIMWLGMDLKTIGEANPYPESYNPQSSIIEKTADGLKL